MRPKIDRILELVQEEIFCPVDLYFAQDFLEHLPLEDQNNQVFLFCYLLACARQGHLALHILEDAIFPSPFFLTSDRAKKEEIEKEVLLGALTLPFSLYCDPNLEKGAFLKPLVKDKQLIYLQKNFLLESKFLFHLKRMAQGALRLVIEDFFVLSPQLNEKQRQAVCMSLSSPLCFISGGPGTGKTFTAAEIVKTFLKSLSDEEKKTAFIKIAAPTGKAAAHLEKKILRDLDPSIAIECGTLHSLLQITSKRSFHKKAAPLFADLFLIDEASMLDAKLFSKLLESLQEGGRLIFMGDKDQLPPVESGSFFADCIENAEKAGIPAITLKECLRVEKKELIDFAGSIILGNEQEVKTSPFIQLFTPSHISQIRDLIWNKCQCFFSDMQEETSAFRILSCIRKGPLGVESLNEMILSRFLEKREEESLFSVPILIVKNCEPLGLMNGDTGYLVAKVSSLKKKQFTSEDRAIFSSHSFSVLLLPSFELGYCLSVHKSQGSEYDSVMALAPRGSEAFGREVLYTAVTRAKQEILLLTEEETLSSLLRRSSLKMSGVSQRVSSLGLKKDLLKPALL